MILYRAVPLALALFLTDLSCRADALALGASRDQVAPAVKFAAWAFPLRDVRLLDGPFRHAMDLDGRYLLSFDTARLARNFLVNAGLPTDARPLGGWESPDSEVRGHFVGHYMSACAQMYAASGDPRYKEKGEEVVRALDACQKKLGGGYLSAFPETFIDKVERREPVWAPYYTLHKILAGLQDMYVYCQDDEALAMARKMGDWVVARNSRLSDAQMQAMLQTEQGGMNETLANLYALTGERKYLEMSLRFNHHLVVDPLEAGEDRLTGLHANTQIPKFIGLARQYELTRDPRLGAGASNFWETVVHHRSYVIGGDSDGEMFTATNRLSHMGPSTTETCNTYNMLKLTRHLFCWDPKDEYAEYYERALCNHILASQNPETGMMCYYVPLRAGSSKTFNTPENDFWCCTGTGIENHVKYGDSIYFQSGKTLYVNQFIGSELRWPEKGLVLRQETGFPEEQASRFVLHCSGRLPLEIKLRHPLWAGSGFSIRVNGKEIGAGEPGSFVSIRRKWKDGDRVEVTFPFALRVERFADDPRREAVLDGPLVLAANIDRGNLHTGFIGVPRDWVSELKPAADGAETFTAPVLSTGGPAPTLEFEPFYRLYQHPYEVYWDQFTPDQWHARQEEFAQDLARLRRVEALSVDFVEPGDRQNERDHHEKGDKTHTGQFGDRSYRDASPGGWFEWQVKVRPGQPQRLWATYWGEDTGRDFDILVDGKKLAAQRLAASRPGNFFDQTYDLPPSFTQGKEKVTVRFQSDKSWVGGVFGLRILQPDSAGAP